MAAPDDTTTAIIVLLVIQQITAATGETASVCLNQQKVLPLQCGTGYMLRITKAFYGYSELGRCHFTAGDCTQAEHMAYPCTGRDSCSLQLPLGGFGQRLTNCDRYNTERYSTYFQVEYFCQPVIQTTDICSTNLLTEQSGFISTPQYPKNYPEGKDCLIQISVHSGQTINLTVIDMDLEINGTIGCHDWMYAFNQDRSVTLCGRRTNEKLTTLRSNQISVRFQSDGKTNRKGFWIYYEAYPPISTTIPTVITEVQTTPRIDHRPDISQTTNTPAPPRSNASSKDEDKESKQKLPFVAIVAGVIGSLTFILIILLMLLVYRWYQDKQPYRVKSQHVEYLDARNPAFRSSTGTEFQGIEIYYNC